MDRLERHQAWMGNKQLAQERILRPIAHTYRIGAITLWLIKVLLVGSWTYRKDLAVAIAVAAAVLTGQVHKAVETFWSG